MSAPNEGRSAQQQEARHLFVRSVPLFRADRERLIGMARERLSGQQLQDTIAWLRFPRRTQQQAQQLCARWGVAGPLEWNAPGVDTESGVN